jgi:hypothetical protein
MRVVLRVLGGSLAALGRASRAPRNIPLFKFEKSEAPKPINVAMHRL